MLKNGPLQPSRYLEDDIQGNIKYIGQFSKDVTGRRLEPFLMSFFKRENVTLMLHV